MFLEHSLGFGREAKETWLAALDFFIEDRPGLYDAMTTAGGNEGFKVWLHVQQHMNV